jgi:hypothetical protein
MTRIVETRITVMELAKTGGPSPTNTPYLQRQPAERGQEGGEEAEGLYAGHGAISRREAIRWWGGLAARLR